MQRVNFALAIRKIMSRVGFEPTPFRTSTWNWRLRPTRPSWHFALYRIFIIYNLLLGLLVGASSLQSFSLARRHQLTTIIACHEPTFANSQWQDGSSKLHASRWQTKAPRAQAGLLGARACLHARGRVTRKLCNPFLTYAPDGRKINTSDEKGNYGNNRRWRNLSGTKARCSSMRKTSVAT